MFFWSKFSVCNLFLAALHYFVQGLSLGHKFLNLNFLCLAKSREWSIISEITSPLHFPIRCTFNNFHEAPKDCYPSLAWVRPPDPKLRLTTMLSPIRMEFTTIVIGTSTGCLFSLGEIYFQFFLSLLFNYFEGHSSANNGGTSIFNSKITLSCVWNKADSTAGF